MALKKCRECGAEISSSANVCPRCGKKLKSGGCASAIMLIVALIVLVYAIASITSNISEKKSQKESRAAIAEILSTDNDATAKNAAKIIETRFAKNDGINIRKGPGTSYGLDPTGQLFQGEKLYILEEKDGWIRFRVTQHDVGWEGWVRKDLTVAD